MATFTAPTDVAPGTTVTFDGSGSRAAGTASITGYRWSFDDDYGWSRISGATIQHTFTDPAVYHVDLSVTDSLGDSSDDNEAEITVQYNTQALFTGAAPAPTPTPVTPTPKPKPKPKPKPVCQLTTVKVHGKKVRRTK